MTRGTAFQTAAALGLTVLIACFLPTRVGSVFAPQAGLYRDLASRYTMPEIKVRLTSAEAGHIDRIAHTGVTIIVEGWAIDARAKRPAKSVQVFIGETKVGRVVPTFDRPDVADFGDRPLFGFRAVVRGNPTDPVRAYAEEWDGSVSELHQPGF